MKVFWDNLSVSNVKCYAEEKRLRQGHRWKDDTKMDINVKRLRKYGLD
jgi:hypothetical protein